VPSASEAFSAGNILHVCAQKIRNTKLKGRGSSPESPSASPELSIDTDFGAFGISFRYI